MISIVKRNGSTEPLSEEKYNRVVMWGVENIRNVSASAVAMGAAASIFDGMTTCQLHEALVKSAADLISPETPNYCRLPRDLICSRSARTPSGSMTTRISTIISSATSAVAFTMKIFSSTTLWKKLPSWARTSSLSATNTSAMPPPCSWRASISFKTV